MSAYKYSRRNYLLLIFVWVYFIFAPPFMISILFDINNKIIILATLLFIIFLLLKDGKIRLRNKDIIIILAIQTFSYPVFALYYHVDYLVANMTVHTFSTIIIILFIEKYRLYCELDKSIYFSLLIMLLFGAIAFFLIARGLLECHSVYYKEGQSHVDIFNYLLTFTHQRFSLMGSTFVRPSGYFDETGALAFALVHILMLNKITHDNRLVELSLMVLGLFTFSLAYYISLFLYMFFFIKYLRKWFFGLVFIIVISILTTHSIYKTYENSAITNFINTSIIERFKPSRETIIKGNTRYESFVVGKKLFYEKAFFGRGILKSDKYEDFDPASIMGPLVKYGIAGTSIFLLHLLYLFYLALKSRAFRNIWCVIILFFNYIQRPFILSGYAFILVYLIIMALKGNYPGYSCVSKLPVVSKKIVMKNY